MTTVTVTTNETTAVTSQPGVPIATVVPASNTKTPAHRSSSGLAIRTTLQNKKKWASTNAGTKPHHHTNIDSAIVAAVPKIKTNTSTTESRKPGAKAACFIVSSWTKRLTIDSRASTRDILGTDYGQSQG